MSLKKIVTLEKLSASTGFPTFNASAIDLCKGNNASNVGEHLYHVSLGQISLCHRPKSTLFLNIFLQVDDAAFNSK